MTIDSYKGFRDKKREREKRKRKGERERKREREREREQREREREGCGWKGSDKYRQIVKDILNADSSVLDRFK